MLSGYKGSGKDIAANYLAETYGFAQTSFAAALKDAVAEQYNIPRRYLDDRDLKEAPLSQYPVNSKDDFSAMIHGSSLSGEFKKDGSGILCWTPRALAILEGSAKRSVDVSYWVCRALVNGSTEDLVISDWRYRSELKQVRDLFDGNVITVRINRFDSSPSNDPSERDLDSADFDWTINNRGTREELFRVLGQIMVVSHRRQCDDYAG